MLKMHIELWQLYTFGAIISLVLFAQFFKLAVQNSKSDASSAILAQGIGAISAFLFIPFFELKFSDNWTHYGLFFLAVIFYALADRIQTTVRKHLEVSVVSIVSQVSTIFMLFYGVLLYQEPIGSNQIIGGGLIILANVFVVYKSSAIKFNRYFWLALSAFFFLATGVSVDIGVSQNFNLAMYVGAALLLPMFLVILFEPKALKSIATEFNPRVRKYYLLTGFFWAIAIILQFKALQTGKIGTVVPLLATNVFLNVVIAYFFLKERGEIGRKLLAAGLVILGIYLTTFS